MKLPRIEMNKHRKKLLFLLLSGNLGAVSLRLILGRMAYHAVLTPLLLMFVLRARLALVGRELEVG